ncbi:MAG: homoserine dehydrogenase [Phycisphaerae bacterium]
MTTHIGLLGCGTVGTAVAEMLLTEKTLLARRSGQNLALKRILIHDRAKARSPAISPALYTTNPDDILRDPEIRIVVEVMGGLDPAKTLSLQALKAGKLLVTANKHLLALHGAEIFRAAARTNSCVGFEASCGGAIPIVLALTRGLVGNEIQQVVGIVNGTCNYILSEMSSAGKSYAVALAEAQAAGFAEPDPTLDVTGRDSAHKLAILAALAFGGQVSLASIHVSGIDHMDAMDLRFGRELGYACKLLAIAEKHGHAISLRVHPAFIAQQHLLGSVNGSFNAIAVLGHVSGQTIYYGRGAGGRPTASAVLADIVEAAMGTAPLLFKKLPLLTRHPAVRAVPIDEVTSRHYLRMMVLDRPGMLHQITGILGQRGISLAAMVQHEAHEDQFVPLVIMTHAAPDGKVTEAVANIDRLRGIRAHTRHIRVIDPPC